MTSLSGADGTTLDDFLGGALRLLQPATGYRAGVDPVLLAASVTASPGDRVLELGCGVGTALLCLGRRVGGLSLTGVELQAPYADLARANAAANGLTATIVTTDLSDLPADLRNQSFDHVLMNPPYFDRQHGTASDDAGRDTAFGGSTPLQTWLDIGARRLAPKGYLTLIQRIERLPETLTALQGRLGSIVVRPLAPRHGRPAGLFLLQARKAGRAPFHLSAPLILHRNPTHERDADDYTDLVHAILRHGGPLPLRD